MILRDASQVSALANRMHTLYTEHHKVYGAHLDITYRCDLDCTHCYIDDKDRWPERNTAMWRGVVEELAAMEAVTVTWSGGEVFARPDFPELLEHAAGLGLLSIIKTHGGNLDRERAAWLARNRVHRLDISVYSLHDAVHDAITRVPGSLHATLQGIRHAVDAGINIRTNTVVFRSNLDELEEIADGLLGLGVHEVSYDTNIVPDHTGAEIPDAMLLTGEEFSRAFTTIADISARQGVVYEKPGALAAEGVTCGAGRSSLYVSPDGAVWPCVMFPMEAGHLRDRSLREIWAEAPALQAIRSFTNADRTACMSCSAGKGCFFCMGDAYKRTGDFRQAPQWFHDRSRLEMLAVNELHPDTYSAAEIDGVPASSAPSPGAPSGRRPERKFKFPIYRPTRAGDRRGSAPGCG